VKNVCMKTCSAKCKKLKALELTHSTDQKLKSKTLLFAGKNTGSFTSKVFSAG
jgi:hypothetical protein